MHKLTYQQLDRIEQAINEVGAEGAPYSYSGRCMYGEQCMAIDFDDMGQAFRFALLADEEIADLLARPRFDSMGLGIVAYWPSVSADGLPDEDEDEDEDAFV